MNLSQIIAYVRGTAEYTALANSEQQAVTNEDVPTLISILTARIDVLERTDPTQATSVREVLCHLKAL
jgi:hypothetical protein